ncbi:hypothetical protein THRCLA_09955 [Thraustotheca clavata]|uniref:Uncharacterized protein n=1 Tax=Thraustotheca clavata TaxID=74557 RepID=A0A1V9YTY6_9STRA|nr:hypothetical protein THRCLA_09955 [Thraustotheca clavata]
MVTFAVSHVQVEPFHSERLIENDVISGQNVFGHEQCSTIVQSSPIQGPFGRTDNGFVNGVVTAYCGHHNLTIRPDDVWLAIMIQFGFYVNGNAESLRSSIVKHQGQQELVVVRNGTLYTVDFGDMAVEMVDHMNANLIDPSLGQWILPSFSTTTIHDTIVGSVVMMASMAKYFRYKFELRCGIPYVNLLGTVEDWENIRTRIEKLKDFGDCMSEWVTMLGRVLDQFVLAAKGQAYVAFWQRICHNIEGHSGPSYICGWISVFCVFNEEGNWQGNRKRVEAHGQEFESEFPIVDTTDIPRGFCKVDVTIDDNGVEYKSAMFAGHVTYQVQNQNTIAPHLSWTIALKDRATEEKSKKPKQKLPRK